MQYLIRLSDASKQHAVNLALTEDEVRRPAIEVVFDLIGATDLNTLVEAKTVSTNQLDALQALQREIFGRDAEGLFIRDGVGFSANGRELNPDEPMERCFQPVTAEGMTYQRCELVVQTPESQDLASRDQQVKEYAKMLFLHEIAVGNSLDVTKDYPDLEELIKDAELRNEIEIDTAKAVYKLSPEGRRVHDAWMREAQELIKVYDIFGDVDVDASGNARFDSGFGKDLRVPIFELEGLNPFRARFLLGLNDGEWDRLENWRDAIHDADFYGEIFSPIESAPSVDELGADRLARVLDQGKAALRRQQPY
jgi:hypothetical protein